MKQITGLISLILFFACLWYLWSNYDQISRAISQTISAKTGYQAEQNRNRVDTTSQEFRDSLGAKLYGNQNYSDMKDPDMASRIYNDRMNRPSKKQK